MSIEKVRRETMRWQILLTLNNARPSGAFEKLVLSVVQSEFLDATQKEVRCELDYLSERQLVDVRRDPDGRWFCKLERFGVDLVDYTLPCEPGIARPEKYADA